MVDSKMTGFSEGFVEKALAKHDEFVQNARAEFRAIIEHEFLCSNYHFEIERWKPAYNAVLYELIDLFPTIAIRICRGEGCDHSHCLWSCDPKTRPGSIPAFGDCRINLHFSF